MDVLAGKYDRQVTLKRPTQVTDNDTGAAEVTYATDGTPWCYLNDRNNNEQFDQQKRNDVKRITIDVRYDEVSEDIDTDWQIEFEGLTYSVAETMEAPEFGRKTVRRIRAERKI